MMKYLFIFISSILSLTSFSQFTIETILADACGNPEGENEMVVLKTTQNIDIDNLVFDWPNNSFLGWCSDAVLTLQLNQTIVSSCGFLLEPPMNIVPMGEKLLIVSSTNMLINANSFDGLTDTLYIIYQCAGNTSGHFSNSANSPRTLIVEYNTFSQSASYYGTSLVGGDGAAINYDLQGNPTYVNTNCNAPVPNYNPNWDFPNPICNDVNILDLNDFISATGSANGTWSGDIDNGHFFNPINKLGSYSLTYTVLDVNSCLVKTDSTINITVEEQTVSLDTIIKCDSAKYKNIWFYNDTTIDIVLQSGNDFTCNEIIRRTFIIQKANYSLLEYYAKINSGTSYEFTIEGNSNYSYSFISDLEDECVSPCGKTIIFPKDNSFYTITVVDNDNLCSKDLLLEIEINYNSKINIPNVFTPNNDGENDVFKIYGEDIETVQFYIYSKWGELIFEGNKLSDFWDGTFKNQNVENGIYVVQLKVIGKDKTNFEEVLNLRLFR